jgi:hypothetical protein
MDMLTTHELQHAWFIPVYRISKKQKASDNGPLFFRILLDNENISSHVRALAERDILVDTYNCYFITEIITMQIFSLCASY